MTPNEIITESFRIIEREMGMHGFAAEDWQVVRRMIHASGDLEIARSIHIRPGAVRAGVRAFREEVPIVTDTRMTAAGIRQQELRALKIDLHCAIDDPEVSRMAGAQGRTRSACALEKLAAQVGEAVYVVGSAPTALSALCAAVRDGTARPRLLIAMPVGFVAVVESKEEALTLDVPLIAVRGRKGGSALATAAVNALLLLAAAEPMLGG